MISARDIHLKVLSSKVGVELHEEDVKKQDGCKFVDDVDPSRLRHI